MRNSNICVGFSSARKLLEVIGEERRPTETTESWLWRISQTTKLHYRVVRAIWYGERISFESLYKLKQAAKKRNDYIVDRLLWRRAILMETDAEFFADEISHLTELVDRFGIKKASGG